MEAIEISRISKISDVIHIESLHSEKAKQLASEISNDVARKILKELYRNPTSISDLSEKLDLPMSTVQYHINRLRDLGIVGVAQKRFGKRMKEVKMYAYEKEGIVFLSTQRQEFETFLSRLITQTIKGLSPKVAAFILIAGLVTSLVGGIFLKMEVERIYLPESFTVVGESANTVLGLFLFSNFAVFSIGALTTYLLLFLVLKKREK